LEAGFQTDKLESGAVSKYHEGSPFFLQRIILTWGAVLVDLRHGEEDDSSDTESGEQ
jgi:hypothetical protein